ncbi:MAG: serpin family protein [Desertimonas sp.]
MRHRSTIALLTIGLLAVTPAGLRAAEPGPTDTTIHPEAPMDPYPPDLLLVRGNNDAAFALLGQMYAGEDVVLSPTSVTTAFAMAAAGADEPTLTQLESVFGYPPSGQLAPGIRVLGDELVPDEVESELGATPVFELANVAWLHDDEEVDEDYQELLDVFFGAGIETIDFEDQEAARAVINDWIAERTHDRIPELIGEPGLSADTVLALVNAAYFQAGWMVPFEEGVTAPQVFTTAAGETVQAPMMHAERTMSFVLDEDVVAVELPYLGGEFVMTVAVPDDVEQFLTTADAESWAQLGAVATSDRVVLDLPRWEAETTADLAAPLTELGLPIPGGSYPGILVGEELEVSAVIHGANITVDEAGTEAAAATTVMMATSAPDPADPVEIRVDQPFVYTITHAPSGLILFAGVETDPTT